MVTITKEILQALMLKEHNHFYIFDEDKFNDNVFQLRNAFESEGLNYSIGYSYKTNFSDAVLISAKNSGLLAEIVSPNEYKKALELNIQDDRIIYNGVIPDVETKIDVALNGGLVNIENFDELEQIYQKVLADNINEIEIGIRINFATNGKVSRFGFSIENDWNRLEGILNEGRIKIKCIQCHTYGGRDLESWRLKVNYVSRFCKKNGVNCIDFGSNMYGEMNPVLKKKFGDDIPDFNDYASTIKNELVKVYGNEPLPKIIIEPGIPLIANCFYLVGEITSLKKQANRYVATTSCSTYEIGFVSHTGNIPVEILSDTTSYLSNVDIYGYTCVEGDLICKGYNGNISVGDIILISNIGAYSYSFSSDFIKERPPVIVI